MGNALEILCSQANYNQAWLNHPEQSPSEGPDDGQEDDQEDPDQQGQRQPYLGVIKEAIATWTLDQDRSLVTDGKHEGVGGCNGHAHGEGLGRDAQGQSRANGNRCNQDRSGRVGHEFSDDGGQHE